MTQMYFRPTRSSARTVPGRIQLAGTVYDGQVEAVLDALVEIWQSDRSGQFVTSAGIYEVPDTFRGFGCSATDSGEYEFLTVSKHPESPIPSHHPVTYSHLPS